MEDKTELAVVEQPKQVAVTVQDRAVIALGGTEREAALKALAKKYADIIEVKNKAGRQQVHAAGMELANERIATKKTGEAAREDANALQRAVIERQKVLIGLIEPEEKRLLALRDKWDEAEAAEKAAVLAAEQARTTAIRAKINAMHNRPAEMVGRTSDEISAVADVLSETVIPLEEFGQLSGEAQVERNAAVKKLREMQAAQLVIEQAAIEAAHQTELARIERERIDAEQKAEAKRLADRAAEIERQEQAARVQQAEADRIALAKRQEADRQAQAVRDAEEANLARQRAEIARQQAVLAAEKAERDRAEQVRLAAIEAEAQARREAAEAVAKLEADHEEGLLLNAAIDAERAAAVEAARVEADKRAAEAEQARRIQIQFEDIGPDADEILGVLAEHWDVSNNVARHWLGRHVWGEKAA